MTMDDTKIECELCWKVYSTQDIGQIRGIKCCGSCSESVQLICRDEIKSTNLIGFTEQSPVLQISASDRTVNCDVCSHDVSDGANDVIKEASGSCENCHLQLCGKHIEHHSEKFNEHRVINTVNQGEGISSCTKHIGRMCNYVCMKCQVNVCSLCALCAHKDHPIKSQIEHDQEVLNEYIPRVESKLNVAKAFLQNVIELSKTSSSEFDTSIQALQDALHSIKESSVFKMTSDMLEKTRDQKQKRMNELKNIHATVGGYVGWLEVCLARVTHLLNPLPISQVPDPTSSLFSVPNVGSRKTFQQLKKSLRFLLEVEIEACFPILPFQSEIRGLNGESKTEEFHGPDNSKFDNEEFLIDSFVARDQSSRLDRWDSGIECDMSWAQDVSTNAVSARLPMASDLSSRNKENIDSPPKPPMLKNASRNFPDNFASIDKQNEIVTNRKVLGDLASELNVTPLCASTVMSSPHDSRSDMSGLKSYRDTNTETIYRHKSGRLPSISESEIDFLLEQENIPNVCPSYKTHQAGFYLPSAALQTGEARKIKLSSDGTAWENESSLNKSQLPPRTLKLCADQGTQTYIRYEEIPISVHTEKLVTSTVEQADTGSDLLKSNQPTVSGKAVSAQADPNMPDKGHPKQATPKSTHKVVTDKKGSQKNLSDSCLSLEPSTKSQSARGNKPTPKKQTTDKLTDKRKKKPLTRSMSMPATSVTNAHAPLNRSQSEVPTQQNSTSQKSESSNLKKAASHGFGGFLLFSALGHLAKSSGEKEKDRGERRGMYVDGYPSMYD